MLNQGASDNAASHGVSAFVSTEVSRPDRGPHPQSLRDKESRSQSSLKGGLGQVPVAAPKWYSFVVIKVQA